MSARDRILGKLRAAPVQTPVEPDVAGYYAQHTLHTPLLARLQHFSLMMRAVHTELIFTRADSWPQALAQRAAQAGWQHVLLAPNTAHGARAAQVAPWLAALPPQALRDWAAGLGISTFVGSSGRVFPADMKAAPLLRAWLARIEALPGFVPMPKTAIGLAA